MNFHSVSWKIPEADWDGTRWYQMVPQDAADSERLKQIADRLQEIGSDDAEPRATKILRGETLVMTQLGTLDDFRWI